MNVEEIVCCDLTDFDFPTKEEIKASKKPREIRAINVFSINGDYLESYDSTSQAAQAYNIEVSRVSECARGIHLTCQKANRIFLFRGDDINIRMEALEKNTEKGWKTGLKRQVLEYNLKGAYLCTYPSQKMAAAVNKISTIAVGQCCRGEKPYIGKRIFLYYGGNIKERMPAVKEALYIEQTRRKRCRPVDEYTLDGQYVKGFPSASAASREYNIHVSEITRCCHGVDGDGATKLTAHGKVFLFAGGSISERLESINALKK